MVRRRGSNFGIVDSRLESLATRAQNLGEATPSWRRGAVRECFAPFGQAQAVPCRRERWWNRLDREPHTSFSRPSEGPSFCPSADQEGWIHRTFNTPRSLASRTRDATYNTILLASRT